MVDSLVNSVIDGRYVIVSSLGRGGMASVYRARDKRLERDVAIKLIHPYLAEQADFTTRFNREARSAAQLSSPYVVAVHDQGVWSTPEGNHAYLVMEYIPGPDTRRELTRLGSFTLGTSLILTEQVLRALSAAHSKGIVHRDVKPENVMVTSPLPPASSIEHPDIHAKVADFGLARAVTQQSTSTGQLMGTISYMAPELVTDGEASAQSDLYAVGIMLYEFLTGSLPFTANTPIATAYKHINSPMPRVSEKAPWLPDSVDSFIGLLTAKSAKDRPEDTNAALRELIALTRAIEEELLIRRIPVIPVPSLDTDPDNPRHRYAAPTEVDIDANIEGVPSDKDPAQETPKEETPPVIPPLSTELTRVDTAPSSLVQVDTLESDLLGAKEKAGATKSRSKLRALFITLFILALLCACTAWYFFLGPGKRVALPNVAGVQYEQALSTLEAQGFTVKKDEAYSDEVASGNVISTDPPGGSSIHPDTPVKVTVSLGIEQVTVPDLSSKNQEQAEQALRQARLTPSFSQDYSETIEKGHVISQSVAAGNKVDHDSTIDVVISQGRKPISVPQVAGKTQKEATEIIEGAGLKVSATQEHSDTVAEGTVISQDPTSGELYRGDTVKIVVSKGPELVTVPNVVGMQQSAAQKTLKDAGFEVNVQKILGGYFGTVRLQDPSGGSKARKGTTITLSVV